MKLFKFKLSEKTVRTIDFMSAYGFLIIGLICFFVGFHSIDLSQHYYSAGTDKVFNEVALDGRIIDIDGLYILGCMMSFIGFFMFGIGNFFFAIGLERGRR